MSGKYKPVTRVGNWSEDIEMEQEKVHDFLRKKHEGSLVVISKQQRLERALKPVSTKVSTDCILRFGDKIMLKNASSNSYLAGDNDTLVQKRFGASAFVTTSPNKASCARNVFTILPVSPLEEGIVRYGMTVRLVLESLPEPVYLHSETVSPLSYSKITRRQEVVMSPVPNGETLWRFLHADGKKRFALQGAPVTRCDGEGRCCQALQRCCEESCPCGQACQCPDHCTCRSSDFACDRVNQNCSCLEACQSNQSPSKSTLRPSCPCPPTPFVIRHVATGNFLASINSAPIPTILGTEYEAHCHAYLSTNKVHVMHGEKRGDITGDYALRRHGNENIWFIVG